MKPESALIPVDKRVEKALELRAIGKSWAGIGRELGCDPRNLRKAVKARYPDVPDPIHTPESRRIYLAEKNAEYLDETGRQIGEALVDGKIPLKALPGTYKALADANHKFESRGVEKETFGNQLARTLFSSPNPPKVTLVVERKPEAIDVVPVEEEGEE